VPEPEQVRKALEEEESRRREIWEEQSSLELSAALLGRIAGRIAEEERWPEILRTLPGGLSDSYLRFYQSLVQHLGDKPKQEIPLRDNPQEIRPGVNKQEIRPGGTPKQDTPLSTKPNEADANEPQKRTGSE
jgi:hypothetical protein